MSSHLLLEGKEEDAMLLLARACTSSSLPTAPITQDFSAVLYAHPLASCPLYDTKVWQGFDPSDTSHPVVFPVMWGGRHHHFKLAITNGFSMGVIELELWWKPSQSGGVERYRDQDILRIGCHKADGSIRDTVWHDDLEHLGTKAPRAWLPTSEKAITLDANGSTRVRLRINRKSEYDVENRYRKEYVIKVICREPGSDNIRCMYTSRILVPAKGMKRGNMGLLPDIDDDGMEMVSPLDSGTSTDQPSLKRKSDCNEQELLTDVISSAPKWNGCPGSKKLRLNSPESCSEDVKAQEALGITIYTPSMRRRRMVEEMDVLRREMEEKVMVFVSQQREMITRFESEQAEILSRWNQLMDTLESQPEVTELVASEVA